MAKVGIFTSMLPDPPPSDAGDDSWPTTPGVCAGLKQSVEDICKVLRGISEQLEHYDPKFQLEAPKDTTPGPKCFINEAMQQPRWRNASTFYPPADTYAPEQSMGGEQTKLSKAYHYPPLHRRNFIQPMMGVAGISVPSIPQMTAMSKRLNRQQTKSWKTYHPSVHRRHITQIMHSSTRINPNNTAKLSLNTDDTMLLLHHTSTEPTSP
ncbi:hypothetical protein EX30DRAFT_351299 [Ascodesmis nigricans]|uniref:Uncharacterized protein n=1 Tax=Ascodesmis nigricans TaxID=341454 RepID=A0A4S2MM13_9PEZI|nr:hypothetical protein EX30DRAFT_351299 [Ascodesmis nigricans]